MEAQRKTFTARQRQVVELIAAGCSNDEVGRRLGLSPRTAKAHSDPAAYRLMTGEDPFAQLPAALGVAGSLGPPGTQVASWPTPLQLVRDERA